MPRLSIVIPATGSQEAFDQTLVAVLEDRPRECEIIVPHADDYVDPYDLGGEVEFVPYGAEDVDFVGLMNHGLQACRGQLIHTLQSGVTVTRGWTERIVERLSSDSTIDAAAPLILNPSKPKKVLAVGVKYHPSGRAELVGCGSAARRATSKAVEIDAPLLQAGFFRRATFETLGLLRSCFGEELCGTDLAARMKSSGFRSVVEPECIVRGWPVYAPRAYASARRSEQLYWHHRRNLGNGAFGFDLACHSGVVAADLLRQLPNVPSAIRCALGRLVGLIPSSVSAPVSFQGFELTQGQTTAEPEPSSDGSAQMSAPLLSLDAARKEQEIDQAISESVDELLRRSA